MASLSAVLRGLPEAVLSVWLEVDLVLDEDDLAPPSLLV